MLDFSNNSQVCNVSFDMQKIAGAFNKAISNNFIVELRAEDMPRMNIDFDLKTKITGAKIDEKSKCLYIEASGLQIMFKYESYKLGTQSSSHSKFYFKSSGASLTVIVFM